MADVESLALRKLAERVQDGKYIKWPWALLKDQFPAASDAAAQKKLQAWAVKNGIAVQIKPQDMRAGRMKVTVRVAVFERQRKPPMRKPTRG